MLKVSNLFEDKKFLDTQAFKSWSPKMKEAVSHMFEMIDEDGNIQDQFETAIEIVSKKHNVSKEDIETYIDNELGL